MEIDLGLSQSGLAGIGFLFGLVLGSFLNVVILRLPIQLNSDWRRDSRDFLGLEPESVDQVTIAKPASRCPACGAAIKPQHNIPLFSFLYLKGRCKACSAPISLQYPLVELLAALLAAFFVYQYGLSITTLYSLLFSYSLLVLTGIDLHEKLLPDQITLPLLWLGLFANLSGTFVSLDEAVVGAIGGYLSLWLVFWSFKLITGKEGMGYGDFKLLAALGAWMGWQMLPLIILISTAAGAIIGVAGIIFVGRNKEMPIAFGPFLAAAGWIAFVWGDKILSSYLGLFNL
ncbi:MAG: prepilin peptidase [Porticoccaceae bacterium]|jgi:leader peptidase (prepilin peptidase) / N-methyltransferase|nr:prepilin peptidase [Porticoccaceae bacterium]MBT5576993.1 prepilin peptidase [Porticoccaceae bacterium]MBT7374337.1 prepilin peptidase [Porticoccaceae bacterium]